MLNGGTDWTIHFPHTQKTPACHHRSWSAPSHLQIRLNLRAFLSARIGLLVCHAVEIVEKNLSCSPAPSPPPLLCSGVYLPMVFVRYQVLSSKPWPLVVAALLLFITVARTEPTTRCCGLRTRLTVAPSAFRPNISNNSLTVKT